MSVEIFLATSTAWQRWLRWDVGGDFPRNVHRLAAGGYDGMSVVVFLATSTAWQRWLHKTALTAAHLLRREKQKGHRNDPMAFC